MASARETAFAVLSKIEKDSAYSNLTLSSYISRNESDRENALAYSIVRGVLERRITVDYNLSLYLTQPLKKLKPQVLTVLRIGAYQLLYMDKIPASAAVNESVKLVKKYGCAFASGLVNAVLHKVLSNGLCLPGCGSTADYLSIKYSYSPYIVGILCNYYGAENAEKIMESSNGKPNIFVRKNTLIADELNNSFIPVNGFPDAYIIPSDIKIGEDEAFRNGLYYVQDLSSQICCAAVSPKENETVIDICAAPGGKSMTMAQMMNNKGRIISCDIHEHKLGLIDDNAKRLGISIVEPALNDGTVFNPSFPKADKVLCDVPCSGFGVTAKKPEIRYKERSEVEQLYSIQYKILCTSSAYVKNHGRLIYSTCTLNPAENVEVCRRFLDEHSDFVPVHILDGYDVFRDGETCTIMPYEYGCDGFFVAVFERRA